MKTLQLSRINKLSRLAAFSFLFSVSTDAAAYLDPGTGSLILQGLIAGIAVASFTIKTYWYKLRAMFGKSPTKSLLDEDYEETVEGEERGR